MGKGFWDGMAFGLRSGASAPMPALDLDQVRAQILG